MYEETTLAKKHLDKATIVYKVQNNGLLLHVQGPNSIIDYWPTTGKWIERTSKKEGFSLRSLIKYIVNYSYHNLS